jgi:hypothetical protein
MGGPDDQPKAPPNSPSARRARRAVLAIVAAVVVLLVVVLVGVLVGWSLAVVLGILAAVVGGAAWRMLGQPTRASSDRTSDDRPIDPFALSEPWRQLVQRAQRSERELERIIDGVDAGPLRDRLEAIAERLDGGVREAWRIARRGDAVDDAVRRLDPVALRSRLETARRSVNQTPDEHGDAVAAVESQLATVERLQQQSAQARRSLELAQLKVEELVGRATEVSLGTADTDAYASDVNDLVIELEAIRQAIDETNRL